MTDSMTNKKTSEEKATEEKTKEKKKGFVKPFLLGILATVVLVGGGLLVFNLLSKNDVSGSLAETFVEISELGTMEYDYTYIDDKKDYRELFGLDIPLTKKYVVFSVNGTIKYGVDLSKIKKEDITVKSASKKVIIKMPEVVELSNDVDMDKVHFYADTKNPLNPTKHSDTTTIIAEAKDFGRKGALDGGIIEKVQDNTQVIIEELLNAMPEFKKYKIELKWPKQASVKRVD